MKNLFLRTLTGLIYVMIITGGILGNEYTYLALFSVVTALCLWEFYGLFNARRRTRIRRLYHCFGGLIVFISTYLYASGRVSHEIFLLFPIYMLSVFLSELYERQPDPITHSAYIFLGHCYITLPLSLLNLLAFSTGDAGTGPYHPMLILALMVIIWVNDTGAYLIGSLFGKHRLLKRISPKKSWEGFFGGLILAVAVSPVFVHFEPGIPIRHWLVMALFIAIFATWGDLVESLIKRTLAVKDSGKTLPGHGGFLDRFDSLLLAVYAVLIYTQLFGVAP